MDTSQTELDYCKELALVPGSLFEFTCRYAPTEQQESLLALYALKQTIGTIPHAPVEDTVKWAKLKWWMGELGEDPASSSRHPVLRLLWSSGVRALLGEQLLQRLLRDAVMQVDAAPNGDETAMFERFAALGTTDIHMELSLDGVELADRVIDSLGAASTLYRVIRSFGAGNRSETGQLPLNLLAKYGIGSVEQEQDRANEEIALLLGELVENGTRWFSEGMCSIKASLKPGTSMHLLLRLAMEERRLSSLVRNIDTVFEPHQHYGPGDAWFAWRFLRRLK